MNDAWIGKLFVSRERRLPVVRQFTVEPGEGAQELVIERPL